MGKEENWPKTPEEIIQQFEENSLNPGTSTYEVKEVPGIGTAVVKTKPSGEEVHVVFDPRTAVIGGETQK